MPGWLIIIIVFVVIGAIGGLFASGDKNSDVGPGKGCLGGALIGGVGGIGCISAILYALVPLAIAFLVISWLFNGCS